MRGIILSFFFIFCTNLSAQTEGLMVRIAEIEVDSVYLKEYFQILKTEARESIKKEQGVISIFPMYHKDKPNHIVILEVYIDKNAYEKHLSSPHFIEYKTSTKKMIKSLKLVDMQSLDLEMMKEIFKKIN
ncbi:MAG: antibiotic biosynthesis monooxygenase [Bacteroidales bacterium]|nr:antibiotic biosynthesis monooxygenase [Bacteroidales bacterium]